MGQRPKVFFRREISALNHNFYEDKKGAFMEGGCNRKVLARGEASANVVNVVLKADLCVGCGVCAVVCPLKRLEMQLSIQGEWNPCQDTSSCPANCDLCLRCCPVPFNPLENRVQADAVKSLDSSELSYNKILGHYHSSWVLHRPKPELRFKSASGGACTAFFEHLLTSEKLDGVFAVGPGRKQEELFDYRLCRTVEALRSCSNSKYYPVHASNALGYILENEGEYAMVALPCASTGIRNLMAINGKLRKRLRYLVGLVCGRGKGTFFLEYASALPSGQKQDVESVRFRVKNPKRDARGYDMEIGFKDPNKSSVYSHYKLGVAYHCFEKNGCFRCTDVFAEKSDVVFMDAWLPRYITDWRGHSLAVTRRADINHFLLRAIANGELAGKELGHQDVLESQKILIERKKIRNYEFIRRNKPSTDLRMRMWFNRNSKRMWFLSKGRLNIFWVLLFPCMATSFLVIKLAKVRNTLIQKIRCLKEKKI